MNHVVLFTFEVVVLVRESSWYSSRVASTSLRITEFVVWGGYD